MTVYQWVCLASLSIMVLVGITYVAISVRLPVREAVSFCGGGAEDYTACVATELLRSASDDPATALRLLAHGFKSGSAIAPNCYFISRHMGLQLYAREHESIRSDFPDLASICNFGFVRGYVFGMAQDSPQQTVEFCQNVRYRTPRATFDEECYRSVGMALGQQGDADASLVERARRAVELCSGLLEEEHSRTMCVRGAFNGVGKYEFRHSVPVADLAGVAMCAEIDPLYRSDCEGAYKHTAHLSVAGDHPPDIAWQNLDVRTRAGLSPDEILSWTQYAAYRHAIRTQPSPEYVTYVESCAKFDRPLREACVRGYATGFAKEGVPQREHIGVLRWCHAVQRSGILDATACVDTPTLGYLRGNMQKNLFSRWCSAVSSADSEQCASNIP